jgi:excisionase family DNA binding protein
VNEYQTQSGRDTPEMLTVMEVAVILRVGRTTAYELAREYLRTNGASGLPVVRIGKQLRMSRAQLDDLIQRGTPQAQPRSVGAAEQPKPKRHRHVEEADVLQLFRPWLSADRSTRQHIRLRPRFAGRAVTKRT